MFIKISFRAASQPSPVACCHLCWGLLGVVFGNSNSVPLRTLHSAWLLAETSECNKIQRNHVILGRSVATVYDRIQVLPLYVLKWIWVAKTDNFNMLAIFWCMKYFADCCPAFLLFAMHHGNIDIESSIKMTPKSFKFHSKSFPNRLKCCPWALRMKS